MSMYIALDPRGIDFAYPAKFKTHSDIAVASSRRHCRVQNSSNLGSASSQRRRTKMYSIQIWGGGTKSWIWSPSSPSRGWLRAGQAIAWNMSRQRRADHCVAEELVRKVIDVNLKK